MIIHTRKYKYFDPAHIKTAKDNSEKVKASTADRKVFLEKIRSKETKEREQNLKRIPYNRLSDYFGIPGIYFLINGDRVVYVGETSCLISRLGQHREDKEFDGFRFLKEPDLNTRLRLEKAYIQKYSPLYNITHNPSIAIRQPIERIKEDLSQR